MGREIGIGGFFLTKKSVVRNALVADHELWFLAPIFMPHFWSYLGFIATKLSASTAARIIDTTSQTDTDEYRPARREQEIPDWLAATGDESAQWIALDDAVWQFHQYRDWVVACTWYVGLDEGAAVKLRNVLASRVTGGWQRQ